jgi:membrane-associated phospholipid phosphatase
MKSFVLALLIATAADKPLLKAVQRTHAPFDITPLGGHDALLISGAMLGAGWLAHDERLRAAGLESAEAQIIASQLLVPVLKRAAGRARPSADEGTYHFEPFRSRDEAHRSFPSAHATTAFAAATAIAAHYDGRLVPTIAYSLAAGVAIARVHDNAHFPSDVVAGAILGRLVAKGVVARHGFIIFPQRHGIMVVYRSAAR